MLFLRAPWLQLFKVALIVMVVLLSGCARYMMLCASFEKPIETTILWPNDTVWLWAEQRVDALPITLIQAFREADGGIMADADYAALAQRYTVAFQGEERLVFV